MLTILYYLITTNDWVSTNDIAMQTRIDKPWTMYCLKKLFKWGIVEKRYIPSRGGVAALWRVKEDAFNGYDKKHVLELFAKHIRMCVEHTA
jgi:predicted transcriptional regulator